MTIETTLATPAPAEESARAASALGPAAEDHIEVVEQLRAANVGQHPLITKKARLPTPAAKKAIAVAIKYGMKQRNAVTWWAHPVTGKTAVITLMEAQLAAHFKGCGIFFYEPDGGDDKKDEKSPLRTASSRQLEFWAELLEELDFNGKMESTPSKRRVQVSKALLALSLPARHLFFIIDEAQEMTNERYIWLKKPVNWLTRNGIQVNFISFAQFEFLKKRHDIIANYRSDIDARFIGELFELQGISSAEELAVPLGACDSESEFPEGSGCSYTHLLLPRAFTAGFRLQSLAPRLWRKFISMSALRKGESGIAMEYVAEVLSELALMLHPRDKADLKVTDDDLAKAVTNSGWLRRKPVQSKAKQARS